MTRFLRTSGLAIALIAALCAAASAQDFAAKSFSANIADRDAVHIAVNYDFANIHPKPVVKAGVDYQSYELLGEGTTYEFDRPLLPAIARFILVPPDAGVELEVSFDEPEVLAESLPPAVCSDTSLMRNDYSAATGLYPLQVAEMSAPMVIRGARMVKVTVFPIQYNYDTHRFIQNRNVRTTLRFTNDSPVAPVQNPARKYRNKVWKEVISEMAINGSDYGRDDPNESDPPYVGHYLVATHEGSLQFIRNWIEFRRRTGYKMDILSLSSNDASNADAVKRAIQGRYDAYVNAHTEPFDELAIVGDHQWDRNPTNGVGNILNCPPGQSIWGGGYPHADYLLACLEGGNDDHHPDVGYSRIPAGNAGSSGLVMGRIMAYEAYPRMENPEWFTSGGVYSQHWGNGPDEAWHVTIHTNVRWGLEVLKNLGFNDIWFYENYEYDQSGSAIGPRIAEAYNDGRNVMIGRAEIYYWGNNSFQGVEDNTVFPIDLVTSGHGEWTLQVAYLSGDANHLKGPNLRTCTWGWGATASNSYVWATTTNGMLQRRYPFGISRALAVNSIEGAFPDFQVYNGVPLYRHIKTDYDALGDPGTEVWIGIPKVVEVTTPGNVSPETKVVEAFVHMPNSQDPVPGAQVTFYAPGRMPNAAADYGRYTDFIMKTTKSDSSGIARFILEDNESLIANTILCVSASGRDIRPVTDTLRIVTPQSGIELGDWTITQVAGNGDDAINPGEAFDLVIKAHNSGDRDAVNEVRAMVTSSSPDLEVITGDNLFYGSVNPGEDIEPDVHTTISFRPSTPDGASRPNARPVLNIDFSDGNRVWKSGIRFTPAAPDLEVNSIVGGGVVPDSTYDLILDIKNIGTISSPFADAALVVDGLGISVIPSGVTLGEVNPGQVVRVTGTFTVSGDKLVVPGSLCEMRAIFTTQDGYRDEAAFNLQIMTPRANTPTGPDKYGYICLDNTDRDWDSAPVYDWIEIDPRIQDRYADGIRMDSLRGESYHNIGRTQVLPLGFTTQFYGIEYDTVTVALNGFISMGNQPLTTNYQNWPMDRCIGGGVGMLAPYWDDLRWSNDTTGIYYYPDTDSGRMVIQWTRMALGQGNGGVTFQVVIYDKNFPGNITVSGDPKVLFQYKQVPRDQNGRLAQDIRTGDAENADNIPYPSVGISSPHGDTGINYYYRESQPVSAAPIQARRALLFSTSLKYRACILYGWVTDANSGLGVRDAAVFTKHGFIARTDETGYWRIPIALAEVPFDITARILGYNDSTYRDLEVPENDSLEIDFGLLHPEFFPSDESISDQLDPNLTSEHSFSIFNNGNGPLSWRAEKLFYGDANAAPLERRRRYFVGDSAHVDRLEGVAFGNEQIYVAGSRASGENYIWKFDRQGALIDSFHQVNSPNASRGYKDIEFDGTYLWGAGEDSVRRFDTTGNVVSAWRCRGLNPTYNIAWDSDRQILWLSGTTSSIYGTTPDGEVVDTLFRKDLRLNGLAYWPEDPDGYKLYIISAGNPVSIVNIYKMNTETNDTMWVTSYQDTIANSSGTGAFITNQFDVYSWVLFTIRTNTNANGKEKVDVIQLGARKDWFNLSAMRGTILPMEMQELTMRFNSAGLPDTLFEGEFRFTHNSDSGRWALPITLRVIGPLPPGPFDLAEPSNGANITALPLLADTLTLPAIQFTWQKSHDPNFFDSTISYAFHIATPAGSARFQVQDTSVALNLDTLNLHIWFDTPLTWGVTAVSGQDQVECSQPFTFNIVPNAIDQKNGAVPVIFGLNSVYPSPFNGRTSISFGADRAVRTTLKAFDITGREVGILFDRTPEVGNYRVTWDAAKLASGVYMLRLESAGRSRVQKIALVR